MTDKAPLTLDNALAVAFSLEGRDKINKVVQYGSRALAFYILSADPKSALGQRFAELYKASQQARKAFRIGKSVPFAKKAVQAMDDKTTSPGTKYLQLINNWGMAGFFVYDNMVFLSKAKVFGFDADEAGKRGGVLWFFANVAGFMLAMNALNADVDKEKAILDVLKTETDQERIQALRKQLSAVQAGRSKKFLAVVKITCDLIVSANTSGIRLFERIWGSKLNDGIIGQVGCVSALIVLFNTWPSAPKPAIEASKQ